MLEQESHKDNMIQPDIPALEDADALQSYCFDTIFSSSVIEHIEDDRTALSTCGTSWTRAGLSLVAIAKR